MGEVKVIGACASLFCTRVEWALKLKGVEYEYLKEDLLNKSPLLLKYNPIHKKVPLLLHKEQPIAESLVILEYIDETWKQNPLLPQDPYERATARFWAKFNDEKFIVGVWEAYKADKGEEKNKAIESAIELLAILEKQIEGKKFFGGEKLGYLDLVMGWIGPGVSVMEEVGEMKVFDAKRFPCLHEWAENFVQNPIIKECLPPRDSLIDYFQGGLDYLRSLSANNP